MNIYCKFNNSQNPIMLNIITKKEDIAIVFNTEGTQIL